MVYKMKKKGYTLIELIVTIAITIIIFSISCNFVRIVAEPMKKIKIDGAISDVYSLISYGKQYCNSNKCRGILEISRLRNEVAFCNTKYEEIRKIKLPKEVRIISRNEAYINNTGYITSAFTIKVMDKDDEKYSITIAVGIDTISIIEE